MTFKNNSSLKLISILLILVFSIFLIFNTISCRAEVAKRFEDSREKMGTSVNMIIYAPEDQGEEILEQAYDYMDTLIALLSNYDKDSEISKLNSQGFLDNASDEMIDIMQISKDYYTLTGGSFDITVDPILTLWSEGLWKESEEIQQQRIDETLELVGSDSINISGNDIYFEKEGMSATLGGIAKGYIVDKVLGLFNEKGIKNALINAGGDIATLGTKPDGSKWTISLENPDDTTQKIATFSVKGQAVATSGNYYRYFDPEGDVHHIIDPRTGISASECISVTIIAKDATDADVLATSAFVMGPEKALDFIEDIKDTEAMIIDNDRNILQTSGIDKYKD